MGHAAGVPVEAELGAIMGHEEGPPPPYEELFQSGNSGAGIATSCITDAISRGMAKINIATAIRQPYEQALATSLEEAAKATYNAAHNTSPCSRGVIRRAQQHATLYPRRYTPRPVACNATTTVTLYQ